MKAFETCVLFIFYIPYCFVCEKTLLSKPETNHCAVALFHVRKNWPGYNHTLFFITLIFNALENRFGNVSWHAELFFHGSKPNSGFIYCYDSLTSSYSDYSWYIPEPGNQPNIQKRHDNFSKSETVTETDKY